MIDWPALAQPIPGKFRKYVDETLRNLKPREPGKLLPTWMTESGWRIVQVPWLAVPGYSLPDACKGQGHNDICREMCLNWLATSGKPVYPEFSPGVHIAHDRLEFDPEAPLHCGWDMPGTPAFVVTQLNAYGQWLLLSSVSPKEEESIGVYDFGQRVADHLLHTYALPHGLALRDLKLLHYGDPAGNRPPVRTGQLASEAEETRSCYEIIEKGVEVIVGRDERGYAITEKRPGWGWRIMPGAVSTKEREEAVRARLKLLLGEGVPALVVDPGAKVIAEGLGGGHHYKQRSDGRYEMDAFKGYHSHTVNALEYIATKLFEQPEKKDEHGPKRAGWASQASGRGRR